MPLETLLASVAAIDSKVLLRQLEQAIAARIAAIDAKDRQRTNGYQPIPGHHEANPGKSP